MAPHIYCRCETQQIDAETIECSYSKYGERSTKVLFCAECRGGDLDSTLPADEWRCLDCLDDYDSDEPSQGAAGTVDHVIACGISSEQKLVYLIIWPDIKGVPQLFSWELDSDGKYEQGFQDFLNDYNGEAEDAASQEVKDISVLVQQHASGSNQLDDLAFPNEWQEFLREGDWSFLPKIAPRIIAVTREVWTTEHMEAAGRMITNSMHRGILEALTGSGLVRRRLLDISVNEAIEEISANSYDRPSIYAIEFTDGYGRPPTIANMETIVKLAYQYLFDNDDDAAKLACNIDTLKQALTPEEISDRFTNQKRKYSGKKNAATSLLHRIDQRLQQLRRNGKSDNDIVNFILTYIGYSSNAEYRLQEQHAKHTGSNKLMCLFEAISHRKLDSRYSAYGQVIFNCIIQKHADMAEIFFSVLTDSDARSGLGLNVADAGGSVSSVENYNEYKVDKWSIEALHSTTWRDNSRDEAARVAEVERMQRELEGLDRENMEMELAWLERENAAMETFNNNRKNDKEEEARS